jgi:hypothetical protein
MCIATDGANLEHGEYYLDKAKTTANEVQRSNENCEHWRMYGQHYFIQQAHLDCSSHYSDIKMNAFLQPLFVDAFTNEGGDFALQFDNTSTHLAVPWHDIIHASQTIMVYWVSLRTEQIFYTFVLENEASACSPYIQAICIRVLW